MTELGIIRQIDDLGRIVIPKEIRRTMKIREGDEMCLSVDKDSIIIRRVPKYIAPKKLLDGIICDLDESRYSPNKEKAILLLRQARDILENEGE